MTKIILSEDEQPDLVETTFMAVSMEDTYLTEVSQNFQKQSAIKLGPMELSIESA